MHRTRVKICGITRGEDAVAAAEAGADAIGMVFYAPAPRNISIDRAKEILRILPPFVSPVGLFVDAEADEIRRVVDAIQLRHVQLHGREPPQRVTELRGVNVIKAVRVDEQLPDVLAAWRRAAQDMDLGNLRGIVLETGNTREPGGTGVANDWATVRRHRDARAFEGLPQLIAAGGLTAQTVGEVISTLRPWAVDVSSGVEAMKGLKSAEKIRAFVKAVNFADQQLNARNDGPPTP